MKLLSLLVVPALLLPLAARAEFIRLDFTGTVTTSVGDVAPLGSTVRGSWVFDTDPALYSNIYTDPVEGAHYTGYLISGYDYGFSQPGWTAPMHFSVFDVYDNGSQRYPALYPADAVVFNASRPNADTLLTLLGPDTSFAGTAIPTADWLRGGWGSGTFSVAAPELGNLMVANVTGITVSAVPEPATALLMLGGLGALVAAIRRSSGGRRQPRAD